MSKYIKIKDVRDDLDDLYDKIKELKKIEIRVGIFNEDSSELLMIARVQEFGASIKVTEKMRGYLRSQGLFLRSDTQYIEIPERSYIRSTAIEKEKQIRAKVTKLLEKYLTTNMKLKEFTFEFGNYLVDLVQKQMKDLKEPKLHPFTIQQKGHNDPLIDSGNLLNGVTYKVVK